MLGRDAELQMVRQWLDRHALRLVTLIGPGGVGKTRLALEIARAMAADDAARVVFVPLAAAGNAGLAAAIAEAFLAYATSPPLICPGASASLARIERRCWCSTISNTCSTRRRS